MQGLLDMTASFISGVTGAGEEAPTVVASSPPIGPAVLALGAVPFTESRIIATLPPMSSNSGIEPVGNEYFLKRRQTAGEPIIEFSVEDNDLDDTTGTVIIIPPNITPENLDQFSYYEILGLSTFGDLADRLLIRKAYRQAVLLYHPGKLTLDACTVIVLLFSYGELLMLLNSYLRLQTRCTVKVTAKRSAERFF